MAELNISNLYDSADERRLATFMKKVDSDLMVDLHYDKVEADFGWLDLMEDTIRYIDNILRNPNRFIVNEDEVVKVELARRVTVESIKHLARNTNFIQKIEDNGDVQPSKILNINKEESYDTYENRLIFTLITNMETFVEYKKKDLLEDSHLKDDKSLQYKAASIVGGEHVAVELSITSSLHSKKNDSSRDGNDLKTRIDKLSQRIRDLKSTNVYRDLARKHVALVRPPVKKTNVILKNTNFQYAMKLWNYLQEHFGDEAKRDKTDKNYRDDGELKGFFDETFLLDYLALCTLNKEMYSTKQVKEKVVSQVIQKIVDLNVGLTEEEIKDLVGEQYTLIKYRNNATMEGISKIYKKHIEKYMNKVNSIKLN